MPCGRLACVARPAVSAGGGFPAIWYVLKKGREAGGPLKLYRRLRSRNACKTCALGMGGQHGGMVNEAGHFPEVCKKSVQAQAGDMAEPIPERFFRATAFDELASYSSRDLERLGRVAFPVFAGPGDDRYRRITWDEAYDHIARNVADADPSQVFFYSSGRSSNEAAFLMQLVARAFGTGNIHNCSFYCHSASSVALDHVYGSGTGSITLDDLASTDLVLLAGANPASNHPRLMTQLINLRRRGGQVIVVNPLRELGLRRFRLPSDWRSLLFGSEVASMYVQPHAGSDAAFFLGLLKGLVEAGATDRAFIAAHTEGWDAVAERAGSTSWDDIVDACGVSRRQIDRVVEALAEARNGVFLWAMGLTHHANGVENIEALANVALARGWLGRPGAGLMPIRGHSNVQGVGSMGVAPRVREAFARRLEDLYGITVPPPGQHTYASMEAAAEGRVHAAVLLGGNLFGSNPDRDWAAATMRAIPFTVSISTKLNEGHIHGRGQASLILPALARDEESQATTQESMFNYVRLSDGGAPNPRGQARSEVEIIANIARRILPEGRFDWSELQSHESLRQAIARTVPGYEAAADIGKTGAEFQVGGRTFHQPAVNTPSTRAAFVVTGLPAFHPGPEEFRLITLRSEGQFNTVVYEEADLYRGNSRRDVVMMSSRDAEARGLREGSQVRVASSAGEMRAVVSVVSIRPGNVAMYYPEANAIVPRAIDPRSFTPAFKSVAVRVEPV